VEIYVVRVKVVRYVTRLTCPGFESVELMLGLRHVSHEIGWVAKVGNLVASVRVHRIKSFVDLDSAESLSLLGELGQFIVLLESLYGRFSNHNVHSCLKTSFRNIKVSIIGSENNGNISRRESLDRLLVSLSIDNVIFGPSLNTRRIVSLVDLRAKAVG
jgi:hypothetical protein